MLEPEDPERLATREVEFVDAPPLRAIFDFSYDGVMRSYEESLRRLAPHQKYRHIHRMVLELEGKHRAAANLD